MPSKSGAVPPERENDALRRGYKAGDKAAFAALYQLHFASVFRFVRYHEYKPEEVDEICQNIWVKLWMRRRVYNPALPFIGFAILWAKRILRSTWQERKRATERAGRAATKMLPQSDEAATCPPDTHAEVIEIVDWLIGVPDQLENKVNAWIMKYLLGWTIPEIAAELGMSEGTIDIYLRDVSERVARKFRGDSDER